MKRAAVCFLGLALSLTACASTPDSQLVTQKNNQQLVEKATTESEDRESLAKSKETAPEQYT